VRPGLLRPNEFELAVLKRLRGPLWDSEMAPEQLHVLSRTFTGVGSFTNFSCAKPEPDAPREHRILTASILMPGVRTGLGAVLHLRAGQPECLEIFTFGDEHWDGTYEGFVIEATE